jgi:hypothetical protein
MNLTLPETGPQNSSDSVQEKSLIQNSIEKIIIENLSNTLKSDRVDSPKDGMVSIIAANTFRKINNNNNELNHRSTRPSSLEISNNDQILLFREGDFVF